MMAPKLALRGLTYRSDGRAIVDDVDLTVEEGTVHALVGPSGSGKTTLLRLIVRLDEPTSGRVELDGVDHREIGPRQLRRRVGWVPQQPAFLEGTVRSNATSGLRLREDGAEQGRLGDVDELLERVGLAGLADRRIERLSGGERQRLGLVRTLAVGPEVLLLDEPTANLDQDLVGRVEDLVRELADRGRTVLVVTHAPEQARRLADAAARVEGGRITAHGPTEEVLA